MDRPFDTALRALLTALFLWFGLTKLSGAESAVALYEALGFGQGVRYVTGSVETAGALLLWVPGLGGPAAAALAVTMVIGFTAKTVFVGGATWHLAALFVLAAGAAWRWRAETLALLRRA